MGIRTPKTKSNRKPEQETCAIELLPILLLEMSQYITQQCRDMADRQACTALHNSIGEMLNLQTCRATQYGKICKPMYMTEYHCACSCHWPAGTLEEYKKRRSAAGASCAWNCLLCVYI